MDTQEVMRTWNDFVRAVLSEDESLEDKKTQMAKAAEAWLVCLYHEYEYQQDDYDPERAQRTAYIALSLTKKLEPLLEAFQERLGTWFNEHQSRATGRTLRSEREIDDST
jgi:hypothetical protein